MANGDALDLRRRLRRTQAAQDGGGIAVAQAAYSSSVGNLRVTSLASNNIFSEGVSLRVGVVS